MTIVCCISNAFVVYAGNHIDMDHIGMWLSLPACRPQTRQADNMGKNVAKTVGNWDEVHTKAGHHGLRKSGW